MVAAAALHRMFDARFIARPHLDLCTRRRAPLSCVVTSRFVILGPPSRPHFVLKVPRMAPRAPGTGICHEVSMLEPVTLGQPRTRCPGLAADERGVVMGRRLAAYFPDIGRAVGFFRSYSREVSLDDILATLTIVETVSTRGGRELEVSFAVAGSYGADRAAQSARMHQGRVFTGSKQHFVPYRDRQSPLGWDVASAEDLVAGDAARILYTEAGADARTIGREVHFRDLVRGLSPRPLTPSERAQEDSTDLVIRVEPGLVDALCHYLWQRRVEARLTRAVSAKKSLFSDRPAEVLLVHTTGLPGPIARLLASTPGMRLFVPVQPTVLVEWGHRHPIALESCTGLFGDDVVTLFGGGGGPVEQLRTDTSQSGTDIADLIKVSITRHDQPLPAAVPQDVTPIQALPVELKLAPLPGQGGAMSALLIPHERLDWFVKLVYMLPAAVLRTYDAALTRDWAIVVHHRGVEGIPFGVPMHELSRGVFVPTGHTLLPRVDDDVLRAHLDLQSDEDWVFFPENHTPFVVKRHLFQPLSRAVVAPEQARQNMVDVEVRTLEAELDPVEIHHERQSMFSLWRGVTVPEDAKKALKASQKAQKEAQEAQKALPPAQTAAKQAQKATAHAEDDG